MSAILTPRLPLVLRQAQDDRERRRRIGVTTGAVEGAPLEHFHLDAVDRRHGRLPGEITHTREAAGDELATERLVFYRAPNPLRDVDRIGGIGEHRRAATALRDG